MMQLVAQGAVALVGILHVMFLVLEMFLWTRPAGRRIFGLSEERARETAALAANQGLYNGFIAAGLFWGVVEGPHSHAVRLFFLSCVIVAGIFGAATAKRTILFVQALPGALALALVLLAK
jgi:putative membrane protein